jgi:signal transduction histidine kinase
VSVSLQLDGRCPASVDAALYRLVEEGLANIERHACAASASIAVERDGAQVVCTIGDDGAGFDAATLARSTNRALGLRLLRGRIEALGGTLDVMSAPHQGTRLHAVIPVGR